MNDPDPMDPEKAEEMFDDGENSASNPSTTDNRSDSERGNPENLMYCPDCGSQVSRRAEKCVDCGAPLPSQIARDHEPNNSEPNKTEQTHHEEELIRKNPKMFRNRPILFTLLFASIIGIPILLIWWIKTKSKTLILTTKKARLREGIISKKVNEIFHENVRNVQVEQGMLQRMLGTGRVKISTAGQSGIEVSMGGIHNPEEVKDIVNEYR